MSFTFLENTMASMSWPEIEYLGQQDPVILWPVAVLEEHGPHLSIAVDILFGVVLSQYVKEQLTQKGLQTVIAPPNYWGINTVTAAFPGSFTLRKETLKALLYDTLASLQRWGYKRVFLFDLHGDVMHRGTLLQGIAEARLGCGTRAMMIISQSYARFAGFTGREEHILILPENANPIPYTAFSDHRDIHAGSIETSFMAYYFPEQVNLEKSRQLQPTNFSPSDWKKWSAGWSDTRQMVPLGYNGDPASIKPELVKQCMRAEAEGLGGLIEGYLKGTYHPPTIA